MKGKEFKLNILIALSPAILWGCNPLWAHFCGGESIEQLLGATYGAFIIGLLIFIFKQPTITAWDFLWCFLAGVGWSVGQLTQFEGFIKLGAATTTPISAGTQLVGVNLAGVMFFGSWKSPMAKVIGFAAVVLVMLGVYLTTKTDQQSTPKQRNNSAKYVIELIFGSLFGYGCCSTLPKIPGTNGWSAFPPQAVGMIVTAVLLSLILKQYRGKKLLFSKHTFKNMLTGFNTGLGTFGYLVSLMINGVSTAFTLSQMSIVVGTLGGLFILHEHKTRKALIYTIAGLILTVIGEVMTGFIH